MKQKIKYTIALTIIIILIIFNVKKIDNNTTKESRLNSEHSITKPQKQSRMIASIQEPNPTTENDSDDVHKMHFIDRDNQYLNSYIQNFQQAQVNFSRAEKIFGHGEFEDAIIAYIALGDLYIKSEVLTPALQNIINKLNENPNEVINIINAQQFQDYNDSFIELQVVNLLLNIEISDRQKSDFISNILTRNESLIMNKEASINFIPAIIALKATTPDQNQVQSIFNLGIRKLQDEQSKNIYRQAFLNYFPNVEL